jgi:hypothetical protein
MSLRFNFIGESYPLPPLTRDAQATSKPPPIQNKVNDQPTTELVGEWPTSGAQQIYYLTNGPNGVIVHRRGLNNSLPEIVGGPLSFGDGRYTYFGDQTTTAYRVWRVSGTGKLDLGTTWGTPRKPDDQPVTIPSADPQGDPRIDGDAGMITTSRTTTDGILRGRAAANLVARRIAPIRAMAAANKAFWSTRS